MDRSFENKIFFLALDLLHKRIISCTIMNSEKKESVMFRGSREEVSEHPALGEGTAEDRNEKRIPLRIQQQIGFLILFSAPGVLFVLLAELLLSETRSLVDESVLLVFTNILGWLCIVSALNDSHPAHEGNLNRATKIEALVGVSLKVFALLWVVLRFLSGGMTFGAVFLAVLSAYLLMILLLLWLSRPFFR